jgi:hypothetical protein
MGLFQFNDKPSDKDLRWFAVLWFPAFAGMVGFLIFRKLHSPALAVSIWVGAVACGIGGLASPVIIRPIYRWLMRLTSPIGWFLSHVILLIAYFGVITPVGTIMRLFHDPMRRQFLRSSETYWIRCEQRHSTSYLRQI